jgi:uncharacterized protein (TIGR02246 family)
MTFRLCALIVFSSSLFAQEAAVREVAKKYLAARIAADEGAIRALFTADADQLVSSGEWRRGREDVVKGTLAASKRESGQRTINIETVRFVTPDVAVADGRYEIGERKMWTMLLMTRTKEGWRIAAIRNMLPAAPSR